MHNNPGLAVRERLGSRVCELNPQVLPEGKECRNTREADPNDYQNWCNSNHSVPTNKGGELE